MGASRRLAGSAPSAALILAVLAYRRRLRRRDHWSRPQLLAYQQRALARLRSYAYGKSSFYRDFHAGLTAAPLAQLPVLTKQQLMDNFDRLVTRPYIQLAELEQYLAALSGDKLFLDRYLRLRDGRYHRAAWHLPVGLPGMGTGRRVVQPGLRLGRLHRGPGSPRQDGGRQFDQPEPPVVPCGRIDPQPLGADAADRFWR